MKTSPRSFSPLVMLAAAIVCWVFALSLALRVLLGASMTGGWVIVGSIFSIVAFGIAILAKEFNEAILIPVCTRAFTVNRRGFPVPEGFEDTWHSGLAEQHFDLSRRSELGLHGPALSANRPRSIHPVECGEPISFGNCFRKFTATGPLAA